MGWIRVSDDFYDHEKFTDVGPLGMAMWITGLAYCNRNLTDGRIPKKVAHRLLDVEGIGIYEGNYGGRDAEVTDGISELIAAGLWTANGRYYVIHDYLDYQPSKDEVAEMRRRKSEAGKKGAQARWK